MQEKTSRLNRTSISILIIIGIWLAGVIVDRAWFVLDNSVPAWDQADYLNGAMNYWRALQNPEWFNGNWWHQLWLLSSKIPPGTYILTAPFLQVFGTNADAATAILSVFSAVLLFSIYGLGVQLFNPKVGIIAAGFCQILPGLYRYRTEFVLDYPVTAIVALNFFCLTLWKQSACDVNNPSRRSWLWTILTGIAFGVALMIKQTVVLFLLLPILLLIGITIRQRKWQNIVQILLGFLTSLLIFFPWYCTNWLLILTSGKRVTVDSAIAEGDPALTTIDAWLYYGKILPYLLSWPLLIIPIVGCLIYGTQWLAKQNRFNEEEGKTICWLSVFLVGSYLLNSLNLNKDARYILPLLPILSLILAQGLLLWQRKWQPYILASSLGLGIILMTLNLFPLKGEIIAQFFSPKMQHHPVMRNDYPHEDVIAEIVDTSPYLRTTLGVLPSTPTINQHNFSFYGAKANFQVYGRQVGVKESNIKQDTRSLSWFLTKTGKQGSVPNAQQLITQRVENHDQFRVKNQWPLPDKSFLKLHRRQNETVNVSTISNQPSNIQLTNLELPKTIPPGVSIPVHYTWEGSWEELQQGVVLLTWQGENDFWLHDHGIAMGRLTTNLPTNSGFQVKENTAMFPPPNTAEGNYTLQARYINRETGESYPIAAPSLSVTVDATAASPDAPELDLVTQLRRAAVKLPQGEDALEGIFAEIGQINQYDPIQDYLKQAETALKYRLQHQETRLDWLYSLALSEVLQRDVEGAIAQFKEIAQLDFQNPYAYAYLAFVYLYSWQPSSAEAVLNTALNLNPNLDILHTLDGVAALMQGHLIQAYQQLIQNQN
ncbi:MAG: phospholipid carrier-dependent glycosyltransferase [Cyanobacteria bacterium SW_9_44_58]|nr:MAG: phospholipid carrier-dependent glycosyltransferase [Cyanobacteria bacterium SW_9_44_58]